MGKLIEEIRKEKRAAENRKKDEKEKIEHKKGIEELIV